MKYLIISFIITLSIGISNTGIAQGSFSLSGQLKDVESKENVIYAGVMITNSADSIITRGITNDKGYYKFQVEPGDYNVIFSAFGYQNDTIKTGVVYQETFLGVTKLKKVSIELEGVSVETSTQRNDFDKDVHVITSETKKGASDTKDVLDKINGITYDRYQGTIAVDNDKNIMILVNGVEKNQEYIKNLAPDRLLRVELVRDPGGRYGLEGYTAVINIILRDDYKGSEFFFKESPIFDLKTKSISDILLINDTYLSYNYTYNKLNLYGSAYNHFNYFPISISNTTTFSDTLSIIETPQSDASNSVIRGMNPDYTIGMDYTFKPRHILSFESNLTALPKGSEKNSFNYSTDLIHNDSPVSEYDFLTTTDNRRLHSYNTLFYVGKFRQNDELNINLTYSYYNELTQAITNHSILYDRNEEGDNQKHHTRLNAEYTRILSPSWTLQIGYGNTWKKLNNEFNVTQNDLVLDTTFQFSNNFDFTDLRHKIYSYASWKKSPKFGVRFGLASELSSPESSGTQFNYIIHQPLADVNYVAGKNFNAKLKWRTESRYPGISEVNPFVSQLNPFAFSQGDPFIKPSTINKLSLRMNLMQGLVSFEPYYHFSNNYITQTGSIREDGLFQYTSTNMDFYEYYGTKINFVVPFSKQLIWQNNLNIFSSSIKNNDFENNVSDWSANSKLLYIMDSTNTVFGLIYQKENIKYINGLGYQRGNIDYWLAFIQKPIFKKRGSIMIGYFLPINFGASYDQGSYQGIDGYAVNNSVDINLVKNMLLLEFNYRFNKGKSVKKTEKELEKETEGSGGGGLF